jgi:hypothetical protein
MIPKPSLPAVPSHASSQVTFRQGNNMITIILYMWLSPRSKAMFNKYISDEIDTVSTHVIDEQPESPSDHDFCLDSFS